MPVSSQVSILVNAYYELKKEENEKFTAYKGLQAELQALDARLTDIAAEIGQHTNDKEIYLMLKDKTLIKWKDSEITIIKYEMGVDDAKKKS